MAIHKRQAWSTLACAALLLLLSARQAAAAPILSVTVSDLANGLFQYSYGLSNPAGSGENIFDLALFFDGDPLDVAAPAGWDAIAGSGFIDWYSTDFSGTYDIVPGTSLAGFVFQSAFGPGAALFQTYSCSPTTDPDFGTMCLPTTGPSPFEATIGPSLSVQPVPEPATLWLMGTGVAGLWGARRRMRRT